MNTTKTLTAAALLALLAITGCSANNEDASSDPTTLAASPIGKTAPQNWNDLTDEAKNAQIDQARAKGNSALIWGEHVEWIKTGYPEDQKQWVEEQVKKFAHTDGPVTEFSGLGDTNQLKITRQYLENNTNKTVDVHFKNAS